MAKERKEAETEGKKEEEEKGALQEHRLEGRLSNSLLLLRPSDRRRRASFLPLLLLFLPSRLAWPPGVGGDGGENLLQQPFSSSQVWYFQVALILRKKKEEEEEACRVGSLRTSNPRKEGEGRKEGGCWLSAASSSSACFLCVRSDLQSTWSLKAKKKKAPYVLPFPTWGLRHRTFVYYFCVGSEGKKGELGFLLFIYSRKGEGPFRRRHFVPLPEQQGSKFSEREELSRMRESPSEETSEPLFDVVARQQHMQFE